MKFVFIFLFTLLSFNAVSQNSTADISRLQWWRDAKMGLFIHWGPVSRIGNEISWSRENYGKSKYDSLYLGFNPKNFNAKEWVALAKAGGMKYIVLTAKHHDGFCLFNTNTTYYSIMNSPFGRDVCKELAEAAHEANIPIGWYFSVADWKDPDCRNPQTNDIFAARVEQQLIELLSNYGKISLLWIDYEGSPSPIAPKRVYDLARKLQPNIIVNNRLLPFTPDESHCRIAQYADYATPEGFVAGYGGNTPWETCTNMGHQWAWKFNDSPRPLKETVHTLLKSVGGNGNLLLNIGPDSLGVFPQYFVERTLQMGNWLAKNARSVYYTKGGIYTPSSDYVSTFRRKKIFLSVFNIENENIILPSIPTKIIKANLLDGTNIDFEETADRVKLNIPNNSQDSIATVVVLKLKKSLRKLAPILPFSTSKSLAYGKAAKASSSLSNFLHNPAAAFDDNPKTYWKLGRRPDVNFDQYYGKELDFKTEECFNLFQNTGWLEVDLGKPVIVREIKLSESKYVGSEIRRFEVQYEKDGNWQFLAGDTKMGENWRIAVEPVKAQKFRLIIQDAYGYVGLREFQLFY